jgi:hypothetical protein
VTAWAEDGETACSVALVREITAGEEATLWTAAAVATAGWTPEASVGVETLSC